MLGYFILPHPVKFELVCVIYSRRVSEVCYLQNCGFWSPIRFTK